MGASSAERWLNCPPSAMLTADMPDAGSEYAAEGTLAHAIGELKLRKRFTTKIGPKKYASEMDKLKADPRYSPEMEGTTDEYLDAVNEIALSFPDLPYVALEQRVDFSQWVPEGFGTADCVLIGAGVLHVVDYKHGKGVPVPAEDNAQLKLYALGAWQRYSMFYDIQTVRWTIVQPRNGGTSEPQELPVSALLDWAETYVKPRALTAAEGQGEYAVGDWCRFCKAKAICRTRSDYNLALEGFHKMPAELLSSAELGDILTRARDLASWLSDLEEYALAALLDGQDIPGWKAVETRANRAWTDQEKAFKAAKDAGIDEAMLYKRVPVTLAALEKDIGKKAFTAALQAYVTVPAGKPALAPESDNRKAITNRPTAEADFADTAS
ncbi:MAG TPA: DUF2800 domain-containing protein [Clostridia bacterium]|nr:DUF2800 domain-containing protein [Clostridia bacterium]